jgi:hypothetical protein
MLTRCRARLAKIKQDQARSMSKRGKGLGRMYIYTLLSESYADAATGHEHAI